MTCNDKCIHFPVCEQKKYDFANIDECMYFADSISTGDCEYEDGKLLKRMTGEYVTYKVDYLLDHLAREVYLLESYRRWKESKENTNDT